MTHALVEYRRDFDNRVRTTASVSNAYTSEAFVMEVAAKLSEAEEINALTPCYFAGTGGASGRSRLRVDGYDFHDEDGHAVVAIAEYSDDDEIRTLTTSDAKRYFAAAQNWTEDVLSGRFFTDVEESSAIYEVADDLRNLRESLFKVRIYFFTNQALSSLFKELPSETKNGITYEFHPWDIERLHRVETSASGREEIDINLRDWAPEGIPYLKAAITSDAVETYLAVVPGAVLAGVYRRYGTRVLESNVRSFLSTRGKVNRGIRGTLMQQPDLFLAYNNGITATASEVTTEQTPQGTVLIGVRDLQIVNGGQTTASIFYVDKDERGVDLSNVFVQMKLILVAGTYESEMVPKISRFANSQNAVSEADFFSNHDFHRRMEDKSRRLLAPARAGTHIQTKWYYERTRGQYQSEKAKLTSAGVRKFEAEYPRDHVITKTDAAKYLMSWQQRPHIVSSGAQKNFLEFARIIDTAWRSDQSQFGDEYFKALVAKGILFNAIRKRVMKSDWYTTGYLANIVTYTLAKLAADCRRSSGGGDLDFGRIWSAQAVDEGLLDIADIISERVFQVLTDENRPVLNVTEWAKREAAWERVLKLDRHPYGPELASYTVGAQAEREAKRDERADERMVTGIQAQTHVVQKGSRHWYRLRDFVKTQKMVTPKELGILSVAIGESGRGLPSEQQSLALVDLERRAQASGFAGN